MACWVEANIFYENIDVNSFLLGQIKPLVIQLEEEGHLSSFHVLGEPGPRLLLRILTAVEHEEEIRAQIFSWNEMEGIRIEFREYVGERSNFGDAWKSVYKVMEAGTRCRLDLIDNQVSRTDQFNVGALIHYFLNAYGFDVYAEARLHAQLVVERLVVLEHYRHVDMIRRIQTLEQRLIEE